MTARDSNARSDSALQGPTPGPWAWFGNARTHEVYLATTHSGRRYVMGFQRWGMKGAQPTFQPAGRGLVPAADLLKFEVGDKAVTGVEAARADDSVYRLDIRGIDCPDAWIIAAAPDLLEAAVLAEDVIDDFLGDGDMARAEREDPELFAALRSLRAAIAKALPHTPRGVSA